MTENVRQLSEQRPEPQAAGEEPVVAEKIYTASIFPGRGGTVPTDFAEAVLQMEKALGMPIWLLVQQGGTRGGEWDTVGLCVYKGFQKACLQIEENKPVALLVESPGGEAEFAYRIARLFQRRTEHFVTIVPQYAKSAATLIALGGSKLLLGREAEIGPLDVQILDLEREDFASALNAVQSLERLNAFAATAIDQTMQLLIARSGKKTDVLLPAVMNYVNGFLRPLLEKIDTIDLSKKSRELKIAEQYATRLLRKNYAPHEAASIALSLVQDYPDHGFVIDQEEATSSRVGYPLGQYGLGLKAEAADDELEGLFVKVLHHLDSLTVIGRIEEARPA